MKDLRRKPLTLIEQERIRANARQNPIMDLASLMGRHHHTIRSWMKANDIYHKYPPRKPVQSVGVVERMMQLAEKSK